MKRIFVSGNYIIIDKNGDVTPYPMNRSEYNEYPDHLMITKHPNIHDTEFKLSEIGTWFDEAGTVAYTEATLKQFLRENTSFRQAPGGGGGAIGISQTASTFADLVDGTNIDDIAYVYNSTGIKWDFITNSYRPSGWYQWNGTTWISNKRAMSDQFELNQAALDGKVEQTDFDNEVLIRANADAILQGNIDQEELDRIAGDQALALDIATEIANRLSADTNLQSQIDQEVIDRQNADTLLDADIILNTADIATLFGNIATEIANRQAGDSSLQGQITLNDGEIAQLIIDLAAEATTRAAVDLSLQDDIVDEATARQAGDEGSVTIHSDVSDPGSGEIITPQERIDINDTIDVHNDVDLSGVTPEDGWIIKRLGTQYVPAMKKTIISSGLEVNTTTTPQTKFSQSVNFQRTGIYSIDWSFSWSYDIGTSDLVAILTIGGTPLANIINGEIIRQEPKDTAGNDGDGRGTNQKHPASQKLFYNATTIGPQDIVLTFQATAAGVEASIWDVQVTVEEEFGVINL